MRVSQSEGGREDGEEGDGGAGGMSGKPGREGRDWETGLAVSKGRLSHRVAWLGFL